MNAVIAAWLPRPGGRHGRRQAALVATAIAVVAVACSGGTVGTGVVADTGPPATAVLPAPPPAAQLPAPSPVPSPDVIAAPEPTPAPAVAPATTRTPVPPRRGRTPTPTPEYRPPDVRQDAGVGLATTADNIGDLYDPFQPEGDREIGYAQYRPGVPRDSITPVYVPRISLPGELQIPLAPEELVMGVEIGGEARAYPIGLMRFREMANDTLGGVPILVSW